MKNRNLFSPGSISFLLALALFAIAAISLSAQDAHPDRSYGMPEDWSHHHLVFSDPGTEREAIWNGTHDHWLKIAHSARYIHQQQRRSRDANVWQHGSKQSTLKRDWNMPLGPLGKVGAGNYPAKYSFNGPPSCSDIAVFNTSLSGSGTQATILAFNKLYTGGSAACTTGNPSVAWAYNTTTGDTVVTSPVLSAAGDQVAFISSNSGHAYLNVLAPVTGQGTAYNTLGTLGSVTATPATFATCRAGSGSCLLRMEFANTDNDTTSSPFYNYTSGSDTLWVGDANGNLHEFSGVFLGTPAETTGTHTGTANPLGTTTITLTSGSFSATDIGATITDSKGGIPSNTTIIAVISSTQATISNRATGAPGNDAITITSAWPVNLDTTALSSPVYDESNYIFVGSYYNSGSGDGTTLYSVTATTGAIHGTSNQLGHGPGIVDAPVVDGTANEVYVSVGNDGGTRCSGNGCSIVVQFSTGFTTGSGNKTATVGDGAGSTAAIPMYSGNFDNTYFSSSNGSSPTGNLWVCGNTGDGSNNNGNPILYRIPITTNTMGTPVTESTLTNGAATCSGISEIYTNSTDYLFLSVTANGHQTGCTTGGCIYSYTNLTGSTPIAAANGFAAPGGTSGIIVDNSTVTGTITGANIYYTPLASDSSCATTTGCAIKLTQAGFN